MKKTVKILGLFIALVLIITSLTACAPKTTDDPAKDVVLKQFEPIKAGTQIAIFDTTLGKFKIAFFEKDAPKAVENFITLAKDGYYNGLSFFKVTKDFIIQSGDPLGTGSGGDSMWGKPFEDEFSWHLWHFRGAVAMNNQGKEDTNGSQFFIVQSKSIDADTLNAMRNGNFPEKVVQKYVEVGGIPAFDGRYTIFAFVYEGMEVIDAIANVEVDSASNRPIQDVLINSVTIQTY